jgi:hypothetical protein
MNFQRMIMHERLAGMRLRQVQESTWVMNSSTARLSGQSALRAIRDSIGKKFAIA